ncbi:Rho1 GTPase [Phlyctochytrium arcticum]|nr:Rho1 GTPase [Phlyctochytrium arcticum]
MPGTLHRNSLVGSSHTELARRERKKLVIVGDGASGKTSLLMVQSGQQFPEDYTPTIFENFLTQIRIKNNVYELTLWDTAGQEDYDRLRPLSYPNTDIILVCFSLINRDSYNNVLDRWYPEVRHFLAEVPKILVGNQMDLRDESTAVERAEFSRRFGWPEDQTPITTGEGVRLAKEIAAVRYFETSAKTKAGMAELFACAGKYAYKQPGHKSMRDCHYL